MAKKKNKKKPANPGEEKLPKVKKPKKPGDKRGIHTDPDCQCSMCKRKRAKANRASETPVIASEEKNKIILEWLDQLPKNKFVTTLKEDGQLEFAITDEFGEELLESMITKMPPEEYKKIFLDSIFPKILDKLPSEQFFVILSDDTIAEMEAVKQKLKAKFDYSSKNKFMNLLASAAIKEYCKTL